MTRTLTDPAWQQTETDDAEADRLEDCSADDQEAYRVWCDLMDEAVRAQPQPTDTIDRDEMPF